MNKKEWKKYYKYVKRCHLCNNIFGTDSRKSVICGECGRYKEKRERERRQVLSASWK